MEQQSRASPTLAKAVAASVVVVAMVVAVLVSPSQAVSVSSAFAPALVSDVPFTLGSSSSGSGSSSNITFPPGSPCRLLNGTTGTVVCSPASLSPPPLVYVDSVPLGIPLASPGSACFSYALESPLLPLPSAASAPRVLNITLTPMARASAPAAASLSTAAFASAGEAPSLSVDDDSQVSRRLVVSSAADAAVSDTFDRGTDAWAIPIAVAEAESSYPRGLHEPISTVLRISSRDIAVLGCSVRASAFRVQLGSLSVAELVGAGAATVHPGPLLGWPTPAPAGSLRVSLHPSTPRWALALPTSRAGSTVPSVLVSFDGMESVTALNLGCSGCSSAVRDVVWAAHGSLAVAVDGAGVVHTLRDATFNTSLTWAAASGLAAAGGAIDRLATSPLYDITFGSVVVAFATTAATPMADLAAAPVFVSLDSGVSFVGQGLQLTNASRDSLTTVYGATALRVLDISVVPVCGSLIAVAEVTSSTVGSVTAVLRVGLVGDPKFDSVWQVEQVVSPGLGSWATLASMRGSSGLGLSTGAGLSLVTGCGSVVAGLDSGSTYSSLAGSHSGAFVAATTNGTLMLGEAGTASMVSMGSGPLASPQPGDSVAAGVVAFDWHPQVRTGSYFDVAAPVFVAFDVTDSAPYVETERLSGLVTSLLAYNGVGVGTGGSAASDTCGFAQLSELSGYNFLDAGRTLEFEVGAGEATSLSRADMLVLEPVGTTGDEATTVQMRVREREDTAAAGARVVGRTDQGGVVVGAAEGGRVGTCPGAHVTSLVRVGCPPGRHLRVRGVPSSCPSASASYRVYGDSTATGVGAVLAYDFDKLGCPFSLYYGIEWFRPALELWDGDTFVELVTGEFVVREVNARDDWGYAATVSDAGCTRPPLTWPGMLGAYPEREPSEAWLPQDHVKCYDPQREGQVFSSDPYHVMDGTKNGIRFRGDRGGMYVYQVRVVEPGYSYCNLTAEFGVDVFGAPFPAWVPIVIIVSIVVISLLMMVCAYFLYRAHLKRSALAGSLVLGSGKIHPETDADAAGAGASNHTGETKKMQ